MEFLAKALCALLFCSSAFAGETRQPDKNELAATALEQVETWLQKLAAEGFAPAANQMWGLIQLAKQQGVQANPVLVGAVHHVRHVGDLAAAEYGSTGSDWRVGGAVLTDSLALSVSLQHVQEVDNSFAMLDVRFPQPIVAFGLKNRSFMARLIHFKADRKARLYLRYPELVKTKKNMREEMQRVYEFPVDPSLKQVSWKEIPFKLQSSGCYRRLSN